jgi:hypothetical protein
MDFNGRVQKSVGSIPWQDYRAANTGMIVTYTLDPVSEIPIREVPEEYPSDLLPEPNYETGTYGLYACPKNKYRNAFFKSKMRYMFFAAKYEGRNEELLDKYIVTGYYRIVKTADVAKIHARYLTEPPCMGNDMCTALRADEVRFVLLADAFVLTKEALEKWGHKSVITRQTRILLSDEQAKELLEYLRSKPNALATYIEETKRLQPAGEEEEGPEIEEEEEPAAPAPVSESSVLETSEQTPEPAAEVPAPASEPSVLETSAQIPVSAAEVPSPAPAENQPQEQAPAPDAQASANQPMVSSTQ